VGVGSGRVRNAGFLSADCSAACPDGATVSRDRMHGRIAHLVIAGRVSAARAAHLAAHDRGVVTIAIPVAEVATGAACRADDVELATVLAMFGGKDVGQGDGLEFLVDAAGALRAAWGSGGKPDWRDADVMEREIAAIRNAPAATRTTGSHLHGR